MAKLRLTQEQVDRLMEVVDDAQLSEEQNDKPHDACYRKVKSRYKVFPSAYAGGALVKCRNVGAANWGNKSEYIDKDSSSSRAILAKAKSPYVFTSTDKVLAISNHSFGNSVQRVTLERLR